jgi:raffinose/stachyose/melibiose transport system permease protein
MMQWEVEKVWRSISRVLADIVSLIVIGILYVVPFIFIFLTAAKPQAEAGLFQFTWPSQFQLFENIRDVLAFGDNRMYRAFWNSIVLTVGSVTLIVFLSAFVAFVMQRRNDRIASVAHALVLSGLIIPPALVPTIFLLQKLGIYKTLLSLIFVEVAFLMPFAILVFRAFMATIPREIDEAAIVDGASPVQIFIRIILPLLWPAIVTVIVLSSVIVYSDFTLPTYFLPGKENITVQVTLFGFMSQFGSQWNLMFAAVLIITIPPLILFLFFQRQIVSGLTTGAIR